MKELISLQRVDTLDDVRLQEMAVIGWGFNAQARVGPELVQFKDRLNGVTFDLKPLANPDGISYVIVRGNDDLAHQLKEQRPTVVLIETPCDCHPDHVRLALDAGARLVLSEKCIATRVSDAADLLPVIRAASPEQEVLFIDQYCLLDMVLTLHALTPRCLGDVVRLEVTLFEEQGVPPNQERAHAAGMPGFFHHVVALAGLWFDLNDLVPVQAVWAKHPAANVPDTYRAAQFKSKRNGKVVVEGAVGKYMKHPRKLICVEGTKGKAWLHRDKNELLILGTDGLHAQVRRSRHDSPYAAVIAAIAEGTPLPPTLLTPEKALRILHLVEHAHDIAQALYIYPDGREVVIEEPLLALGNRLN